MCRSMEVMTLNSSTLKNKLGFNKNASNMPSIGVVNASYRISYRILCFLHISALHLPDCNVCLQVQLI